MMFSGLGWLWFCTLSQYTEHTLIPLNAILTAQSSIAINTHESILCISPCILSIVYKLHNNYRIVFQIPKYSVIAWLVWVCHWDMIVIKISMIIYVCVSVCVNKDTLGQYSLLFEWLCVLIKSFCLACMYSWLYFKPVWFSPRVLPGWGSKVIVLIIIVSYISGYLHFSHVDTCT